MISVEEKVSDFETVREAVRQMYMEAGEPDEWAPYWKKFDPALDRIEAENERLRRRAETAEVALNIATRTDALALTAENERLRAELDEAATKYHALLDSKWSSGGAMTTQEGNALRQENERLRAALASLDFLDEDYEKWPWMVKRKGDEARQALEGTSE